MIVSSKIIVLDYGVRNSRVEYAILPTCTYVFMIFEIRYEVGNDDLQMLRLMRMCIIHNYYFINIGEMTNAQIVKSQRMKIFNHLNIYLLILA